MPLAPRPPVPSREVSPPGEGGDLLSLWKQGKLPQELLDRAGVPRFMEWMRQTTGKDDPYEGLPLRLRPQEAQFEGLPEELRPKERISTEGLPPELQPDRKTDLKQVLEDLGKWVPTPKEYLIGGPAVMTTKPVMAALEMYGEKVSEPFARATMHELFGAPEEPGEYEKWLKEQEPGVVTPVPSPLKLMEGLRGEEAHIKLGTAGVAYELTMLPLWLMPAGKASKAAKLKGLAEFAGKEVERLGVGSIDDIVKRVGAAVPEAEAKKIVTDAAEKLGLKVKVAELKPLTTIEGLDVEINRITKALSYPGAERRSPTRIAEMHQMRDRLIAEKSRLTEVAPRAAEAIPAAGIKAEGETIAKQLDVTYNGPQMDEGKFLFHLWTDKQTGSTFAGKTLAEARKRLSKMREAFAKAPPEAPRAAEAIREVAAKIPAKTEGIVERVTNLIRQRESLVGELATAKGAGKGRLQRDLAFLDKQIVEAGGKPPIPPTKPPIAQTFDDAMSSEAIQPARAKPFEKIKAALKSFEVSIIDEFARFNALGTKAAKAKGIKLKGGIVSELEFQATMVRAVPGRASAEFGAVMDRMAVITKGKPILSDAVDKLLLLRHQAEVLEQTGRKYFIVTKDGKKVRIKADEIDKIIDGMRLELGADDFARVEEAAAEIPALYNRLLRESPEITPEVAEMLIGRYPWYNPLLYETEGIIANLAMKGTLGPKTIRALLNIAADKAPISPLKNLSGTIARRMQANAANKTRLAIVEALQAVPEYAAKVKVMDKKPKGAFIDFWENGQRKYLQLGEGLQHYADDLKYLEQIPNGQKLIRLGHLINVPSRAAFTTFSPAFAAGNAAFDTLTALMREGVGPLRVLRSLGRTLQDMVVDDKVVRKFSESGGDIGGWTAMDKTTLWQMLTKHTDDGRLLIGPTKGWNVKMKKWLNPFQLIKDVVHAGELAPRVAVFEKALAAGETAARAAFRSRRATVDFARMGELGRHINAWYLFANASKEGFLLPWRSLRENPVGMGARLLGLCSATVGMYAWNRQYPEYEDVPDYIKCNTIHFLLPSEKYNKYGEKEPRMIIIAPILREWGVFTAPITYAMRHLDKKNPEDFDEFAKTWFPAISPLNNFLGTGGGLVKPPTQVLQTITQMQRNHDDFRNRDIVPEDLLEEEPGMQFDQTTSNTAVLIGRSINYSPMKIDFFIRNTFGGMGRDVTAALDRAIESIDREYTDDPELLRLVTELRAIQTTVTPDEIPVEREAFLNKLDPEVRKEVLVMERIPEDRIPFVSSVLRRFYKDVGTSGQVWRTAREKAKDEYEIPEEKGEEYTRVAKENASGLMQGQISKKTYDDQREYYRAYYAGRTGESWREAVKEGAVPSAETAKYLPEAFERPPKVQALSDYFEVRDEVMDIVKRKYGLNKDSWAAIESVTMEELGQRYTDDVLAYVLEHKLDWIYDLPEPARSMERVRARQIESGEWFDNYDAVRGEQ